MSGLKTGLAARLKNNAQDMLSIHCLAHRLELSLKDSVKKVQNKLYDKAETLLMGLYYFYKKSPKQRKQLESTFILLNADCSLEEWAEQDGYHTLCVPSIYFLKNTDQF